ncbi:MAG TPA: hypothetical protein VGH72_33905 [Pseudonocardia sp.]|jgi:hypothetical protein
MRSRITSSFGPRILRYTVTWTGRHRSRHHSIAYWIFGIWMLELCLWMLVGGAIATFYATVWTVRAVGWLAVIVGGLITSSVNWWFDYRATRKAKTNVH